MWIIYVLFYGLMKGVRDVIKKIALKKNSIVEILLVHTGLSFLMVIPTASDAFAMDMHFMGYIALKALFVFSAWIFGFKAISKLPVSIVGILDLSRTLFATMLGVLVLGEGMGKGQWVGLTLVCFGLVMLRFVNGSGKKNKAKEDIRAIYVVMTFASCILNSLSGFLDKVLMKDLSSSQLQFWFMLFMFIYYVIYAIATKTKVSMSVFTNIWVWVLSIIFVLADKALFIANGMPDSRITVMTLVKQSCCIVTIIGGKLVFKEKNIGKKLICAAIIITGIMISIYL